MPNNSEWKDRILKLFRKAYEDPKQESVLRVADIVLRIDGVSSSVVTYWINQFLADETIVRVKYGQYQLNPSPLRTIDSIREQALELGKARVIDTGRPWVAGEQVIQSMENPTIIPRRRHFKSIIERMKGNPSFSTLDIELLTTEVPHLNEEQKMSA